MRSYTRVSLLECEFLTDLYEFELTDFVVIMGMDWLAKYQVQIDYLWRKLTLKGPNGEKVVHRG